MKIRTMAWLISLSLLVLFLGLTVVEDTTAQTQGTENLLVNPGFEAGHHKQNGVPELTVPNGWYLHFLDNSPFPGSDGPAARPESVVWFIGDAPPDEQELFFRDGSYALKVFKGGRPVYAGLSQDVNGLEVGRRYRLVAPIYIDIVANYNSGNKIAPGKLESGLVRLGASPVGVPWLEESAIDYSGFWTAATVSPFYLSYPIFVYDFTATNESMTVYVEFGSRDPYPNNGFFLDTIGLYTLDEVDSSVTSNPAPSAPSAPSGPAPTPFPTPTPRADGAIIHVVQAGDTFWTIAIQYASALGLTPEEALPVIRELNDNPTFLNIGQEVIIALPEETAAPPAAETTTAEVEAESSDAAVEEPVTTAEEETAPAEPTAAPVESEVVAETELAEAAIEPEPVAKVDEMASSICVSAFNDENGDGTADPGEGLLPDAVFTVSHASGTVATYVSDGVNEPYCFQDLEADTYQISFSQPADYRVTTTSNWAIAVSDGASIPVQFGAQFDAVEVAAAPAELEAESAPAVDVEASPSQDAGSTGFASRVGTIVLGVAVALIVLAVVGVVLLRRS